MNDKGYSWPEAMLVLLITTIIFGTLLPFASNMAGILTEKKRNMWAAKAAYAGAIIHSAYGETSGIVEEEGVSYYWSVEDRSICVSYAKRNEEVVTCFGS